MSTDNKNQDGLNQDPNNGDSGVDESPETKNSDDKKTFTSDEVNKIVQNRLSKEKEKYKDYEDLKSKVTEFEKTKTELTGLKEKLSTSETTLGEVLNSLTEDIEDDKKTLIPETMNVIEKLQYISKNRKVLLSNIEKPVKPNIPADDNPPKGDGSLINGKYTSLYEFARLDPSGYLKWRRENP